MTALLIGTALAIAALVFVLQPMFVDARPADASGARRTPAAGSSDRELAVAALREIEFDRATGKLSDADYAELKRSYTARALEAMRRAPAGAVPSDDELESLVARFRANAPSCVTCGPRPEPDAVYCSDCGRYLPGRCPGCGAEVGAPGARFCAGCGTPLAA